MQQNALNIKSKTRMTYNTQAEKTQILVYFFTKLCEQWITKDFLWRLVEYSGSWQECPQVLTVFRWIAGGSKCFKACVGAHKLQNRSRSDLLISLATVTDTKCH